MLAGNARDEDAGQIWPAMKLTRFLSESKIRCEAVKFALNLPSRLAKFSAIIPNLPLVSVKSEIRREAVKFAAA